VPLGHGILIGSRDPRSESCECFRYRGNLELRVTNRRSDVITNFAWDSSALKEPHVMVPAQTCVTVMSVVPNLTFFRVVLRFTVAIVSCGAVVDETF